MSPSVAFIIQNKLRSTYVSQHFTICQFKALISSATVVDFSSFKSVKAIDEPDHILFIISNIKVKSDIVLVAY